MTPKEIELIEMYVVLNRAISTWEFQCEDLSQDKEIPLELQSIANEYIKNRQKDIEVLRKVIKKIMPKEKL